MKTKNIRITPKWGKSKDEFWADTFKQVTEVANSKKSVKMYPLMYYAAILILAIGLPLTAYLFTKTIEVCKGEHQVVMLPDNSKVVLNAESKLSYKPFWWYISRETYLQGEGYFKVSPGSTFTVFSGQKSVEVLGTSFNIYSRDLKYSVTCLSGQVQVQALNQSMLLLPHMNVEVHNTKLKVNNKINTLNIISWTQNRFSFVNVPLTEVVAEVERQYNIEVSTYSPLNHQYTGSFSKNKTPVEVLEIIGKPFGIQFKIK